MRSFFYFPALVFLPALAAADKPPAVEGKDAPPAIVKKTSTFKEGLKKEPFALKPGSKMERLRLQRTESAREVSFITLNYVEVLTEDLIFGENVIAKLFRPEADIVLKMKDAYFNMVSGILKSKKDVVVEDPRYVTKGCSVVADIATNEIYLDGPVIITVNQEEVKARSGTNLSTDKK